MRVGLVGAGLIGRGWACVFARAGHDVALWDSGDPSGSASLPAIHASLDDLEREGLLPGAAEAKQRVRIASSLEDAVDGAAFVQESVPENAEAKRAVFLAVDASAPKEAILGSSSSAIPGSRFLSDVPGRARCLVAHPANPPHLMPVVELAPAPFTDPAVVTRAAEIMAAVGQVPVVVHGEVEGFVMNRLQAAVVNEAVSLVARGAVSPRDIDLVMRWSLGLRWSFMGPFETMDLNAPSGFLDYATRYGSTYQALGRELDVASAWPASTLEAIEADRRSRVPVTDVAARQRWRDRRLMRLLRGTARDDRELGQ